MKSIIAVVCLFFAAASLAAPSKTSSVARRLGAGFATASNLTGTTTAISGWLDIDADNGLQALASIPSSSPFQATGGLIFKHLVSDSQGAGFHVGAGVGLGSINKSFAMGMSALAGLRVTVPGAPQVQVHFDGGPAFSILNDKNDFAVEALSPALGASILYFF